MTELNPETLGVATFLLTTMVIGGTELVKRAFDSDWRAVAIILVASVVGGFGGAILLPAIGLVPGMVIGLSGSGIITGIKSIVPSKEK